MQGKDCEWRRNPSCGPLSKGISEDGCGAAEEFATTSLHSLEELGVHRRLLYKWRDCKLEPIEDGDGPPATSRERELRLNKVGQLKRLVADKRLEADFFRGALQKIGGSTPGTKATLAGRHLRTDQRSDVDARAA